MNAFQKHIRSRYNLLLSEVHHRAIIAYAFDCAWVLRLKIFRKSLYQTEFAYLFYFHGYPIFFGCKVTLKFLNYMPFMYKKITTFEKIFQTIMKRLLSALVLSLFCTCIFAQNIDNQSIKIMQVMNLVKTSYVDTVSSSALSEAAIRAILKQLDPHCSYIPAEDVVRSHEGLNGNFEGIGVTYMMIEDTVVVDRTISGCPAERVGILPGDRIIRVDTTLIAGNKTKLNDVAKLIRGKRNTTVSLTIVRRHSSKPIIFKVVRDKIPINSVDASYFVAPGIGYIKINSFSLTTPDEFNQAVDALSKTGNLKSLIIDLQSNGGGIMNSATDIVSRFIPRGKELLSIRGAHLSPSFTYSTGTRMLDIPLCILIDEYTASASEIVAGALQDWDRAVIIGRRSFGKGLVQKPVSLIDGSEVRITIARYYTPSGRNIQKPYDSGTDKYFKDIETRYKHGELINADSIQFPDSLKFSTRIDHRTVYGGGGIFPDVFVSLDTTRTTPLYRSIVNRGILTRLVRNYNDSNRDALARKYRSFEDFNANFTGIPDFRKSIEHELAAEKIEFTDEQLSETLPIVELQAKALVAQTVYGAEFYFHVTAPLNDILQSAIKYLQK